MLDPIGLRGIGAVKGVSKDAKLTTERKFLQSSADGAAGCTLQRPEVSSNLLGSWISLAT